MPAASGGKPPKRCQNWAECGNDLPDPRATWCPDCGADRRLQQRKKRNRRYYEAVRDPGSVLLHPEQAGVLQEDLGLLAREWNAYEAAAPENEPAARDRLHEVLEGVLVELWEDLPARLTHGGDSDNSA